MSLIDETGKLIVWKKTKYYPIITEKVRSGVQIYNGKYQCYVQKLLKPFVLAYVPGYISYVLVDGSPIIYDVYNEKPDKPKLRIKL